MLKGSYGSEQQKKAYDETAQSVRQHWQQQGREVTHREVETFMKEVCERADRGKTKQ